jgi:NAD(P)-dependent dehydrogenase (short-subunit alcohol dehydrogenase family)
VPVEPEATRDEVLAAVREGGVTAPHAVVLAAIDPASLVEEPLGADPGTWLLGERVLTLGLHCAQAGYDLLTAADAPAGRLVLVVPTIGLTGGAGRVPAAAASEGLRAMAKSAARQWGGVGITTACVAVPPELLASGAPAGPPVGAPALGRAAVVEDVAEVVAMLLGPAGAVLTGVTLPVDGGSLMLP